MTSRPSAAGSCVLLGQLDLTIIDAVVDSALHFIRGADAEVLYVPGYWR